MKIKIILELNITWNIRHKDCQHIAKTFNFLDHFSKLLLGDSIFFELFALCQAKQAAKTNPHWKLIKGFVKQVQFDAYHHWLHRGFRDRTEQYHEDCQQIYKSFFGNFVTPQMKTKFCKRKSNGYVVGRTIGKSYMNLIFNDILILMVVLKKQDLVLMVCVKEEKRKNKAPQLLD